jgi:hypothetical protein
MTPALLRRLSFGYLAIMISCCGASNSWIREEGDVPAYTLPDPLVSEDGSVIKDAVAWTLRRRPELLERFAREVYGRTPGGRPSDMRWEVSIERGALGGRAVRKQITVWLSGDRGGPQMHVLLYQPMRTPPSGQRWPVFLGLNFLGNASVADDPKIELLDTWVRNSAEHGIVNNRATERTRGVQASRWAVETLIERGYATATVHCGELCPDHADGLPAGAAGRIFGTRPEAERAGDEWGALGMWAWGLSRAMDYLEADPELDASRVVVHGHSRLGKAALWAAAQDERFAAAISNNSGCGGAALSKRAFGETVGAINRSFPHWFARNFRRYNRNERELPIDQHQLLALVAPRPIHVGSAQNDLWADPRGEFLSVKGAESVYALFGKSGLGVAEMPAAERPVFGDALAYHLRSGDHDITAYDWARYLEFADRVLGR